MKIFFGYLVIFVSYYLLGLILGSSFFEELDITFLVLFLVLVLVSLPNCLLSVRSERKSIYNYWLISSIVPGAIFMLYARIQDSSGGFVKFSWDWGLWELILPAIFIIVQLIFLPVALSNKKKKVINKN